MRRLEAGYEGRLEEARAFHGQEGVRYSDSTLQSVAAFDEDEVPLEVVEGKASYFRTSNRT